MWAYHYSSSLRGCTPAASPIASPTAAPTNLPPRRYVGADASALHGDIVWAESSGTVRGAGTLALHLEEFE